MIDDEISKYIELIDTLLIGLSDAGAVAFGLSCFSRQRLVLDGLAGNKSEYQWLTRIKHTEDEWWKWCESGTLPITLIGKEARVQSAIVLEKLTINFNRVMHTGLTACDVLFSGLEEGQYRCVKYTTSMNIDMINQIKEELTIKEYEHLVLREISRQKSEVSVLKNGFFPETRKQLVDFVPDQLLLGDISWTNELWQR